MSDGEALIGPGVKDARFGQPAFDQLFHTPPTREVFLTAAAQRTPPHFGDTMTERIDGMAVRRHGVIVEVAGDDLLQPFSRFDDRLVHPLSQLLLDRLELRPHAVASACPFDEELALAGFAVDEGEAQEVEGS